MAQEFIRNIVERAIAGETKAKKEIVKLFGNDIVFRSQLYLGNVEEAKKNTSSLLLKMMHELSSSLEANSFEDWYRTMLRDTTILKLIPIQESMVRIVPYTKEDEKPALDIPYTESQCRRMILHIFENLPKAERVVSALYFHDRLSINEIAKKLYLTEDEVTSLLTTAKAKINHTGLSLDKFLAMMAKIQETTDNTAPLNTEETSKKEEPIENGANLDDFEIIDLGTKLEDNGQKTEEIPVVKEEVEDTIKATLTDLKDEPKVKEKPVIEETEDFSGGIEVVDFEEELISDTNPTGIDFSTREVLRPRSRVNEDNRNPSQSMKVGNRLNHTRKLHVQEEIVDHDLDDRKRTRFEEYTTRKTPKRKVNMARVAMLIAIVALLAWLLLFLLNRNKTQNEVIQATPAINTPTPTPTAEATPEVVEENKVLGEAKVRDDISLNIRSAPSTDAEIVGAATGRETFEVLEESKDDTYTWYRIGEDRWIASDGTWITFTKK